MNKMTVDELPPKRTLVFYYIPEDISTGDDVKVITRVIKSKSKDYARRA